MIPLLFPKSVYAKRQKLLAEGLEANRDLVILFNATEKVRSHDTSFPYRPDNSFLYLCGFDEPNSVLMLWREGSAKSSKICFQLLVQPRDPEREHWEGELWGPDRAQKNTGATHVGVVQDFEKIILNWLQTVPPKGTAPRIFSNTRHDPLHKDQLDRTLNRYRPRSRDGRLPVEFVADITSKVDNFRLIKDSEEIKIMRQAAEINMEAHRRVMKALKPGMYEYQLAAIVEGYSISQGALHQAYEPICATGVNATCLHYRVNHTKTRAGELFLIDAGCEYKHYASDITRTLPVSGKYSKAQRTIMDLVAEAHQEVISKIKPGMKFKDLHETANEVLAEGLIKLKLLKGSKKDVLEKNLHRKYYTHGTSHWLGMDVHDPASVFDANSESVVLQPGMVFTVEPGLYFMANDKSVPAEYRGIGIRIEDDVLVTKTRGEMLTADLPRTASQIEKYM